MFLIYFVYWLLIFKITEFALSIISHATMASWCNSSIVHYWIIKHYPLTMYKDSLLNIVTYVIPLYYTYHLFQFINSNNQNHVGDVMVSVLSSSAVDRRFKFRSGEPKTIILVYFCFSVKHTALSRKKNDWLARNQDKVFEWSYMSIRKLLFQWVSTIKVRLSVLVWYKADLIIISLKINLFSL